MDLFTGIGGISLALKPYVRTVAYCESDAYAQAVLIERMAEGRLEQAPIWDDVRTLSAADLSSIDIIFGGFPCQDLSVAGRQAGLGGERSGLFFEVMRLAEEIKPEFIFLENVPGIRKWLSAVGRELADRGFDCRWGITSAQEVGANHIRKRWFCLAHAASLGDQRDAGASGRAEAAPQGRGEALGRLDVPVGGSEAGDLSDSIDKRRVRSGAELEAPAREPECPVAASRDGETQHVAGRDAFSSQWWSVEPDVGRVAHGVSQRVDRIKCLGNAVVPLQARTAFERLAGIA